MQSFTMKCSHPKLIVRRFVLPFLLLTILLIGMPMFIMSLEQVNVPKEVFKLVMIVSSVIYFPVIILIPLRIVFVPCVVEVSSTGIKISQKRRNFLNPEKEQYYLYNSDFEFYENLERGDYYYYLHYGKTVVRLSMPGFVPKNRGQNSGLLEAVNRCRNVQQTAT